jgi:hypothetical protein
MPRKSRRGSKKGYTNPLDSPLSRKGRFNTQQISAQVQDSEEDIMGVESMGNVVSAANLVAGAEKKHKFKDGAAPV